MDDLVIAEGLVIPSRELQWEFSTSGGPGGQHANRSATRVELRFDLASSPSVSRHLKERMLARLGGRASGGVVSVVAGDSRSQWQNRQAAQRRLGRLLSDAMEVPKQRRATKPSVASRRRRVESKRRRSQVKRLRKPPVPD